MLMAIKNSQLLLKFDGQQCITGSISIKFGEILCCSEQLGNLLSLCREIAGARDILQKFEYLKKQHE